MDGLGKADRVFFDSYIDPNLGTERADVRLGPQHGVDGEAIDHSERDPFWSTFEEYMEQLEEEQ